jgi:hypothetical protein
VVAADVVQVGMRSFTLDVSLSGIDDANRGGRLREIVFTSQ